MEWTEDHDHSLCQEILALEPFKAKKESIARGQIWDQIASNLNSLEIPRFKVTKHSVRERYTLLIEKLKKKLKEEEKASGIETDMNDVEKTLEEILDKEADAENTLATDKKRVDNVKAVEMRNRAMESMRTTQKRNQGDEDKDVENAPKPKKTRSGGDTVAYLCEKNDMVQKWKAEELELHKQRLQVESRKQDEFQKQQQAMMQMMAQQQQQFQMFASMQQQQQQTQVILKLLEKQTK
ncbi:hypothetical protein P5673_014226 [Acropora cervicornis]|uniref:Uncharacterized protein n=1 Tax=Acropora cervicornis TaxID=6130 RepID=A0AAD9V668_ACRCE|nr:hypothetical protein P5673_014226 [Acropora cervicornis]